MKPTRILVMTLAGTILVGGWNADVIPTTETAISTESVAYSKPSRSSLAQTWQSWQAKNKRIPVMPTDKKTTPKVKVDTSKKAVDAAKKAADADAKAAADAAAKAAADQAAKAEAAAKAAADAAKKAAEDALKNTPVPVPAPDVTEHDHDEAAGHGSDKDYSFIFPTKDGPARWNPCAPIKYQLNLSKAPAGAANDVAEALRLISKASGLRFERVSDTTFVPYTKAGTDPISAWGDADLVIAWGSEKQSVRLVDDISGLGGPTHLAWTNEGPLAIKKGAVLLNSDQNNIYPAGFGKGQNRGGLLLHEISHAIGLSHVDSSDEVMGQNTHGQFGKGDLEGLRLLGATQGCLTLQ